MSNAETLSLLTPVPCKPFSILRYKGDTCNTPRRLSTTASLETYPLYSQGYGLFGIWPMEGQQFFVF